MVKTEIKKGFVINLPRIIVERANLKEGEKLIIDSPTSGMIVLERKTETTDVIEASRGLWKNRKDMGESVKRVRKIRREWEKRLMRFDLGRHR